MPTQIPYGHARDVSGKAANSMRQAQRSGSGQRSPNKEQAKQTPKDLLRFICESGKTLKKAAEQKQLKAAIEQATRTLSEEFGASYQDKKFPPLNSAFEEKKPAQTPQSPKSLAEMFLWKQGDWLKYKKFCSQYYGDVVSTGGDVVIFAFARHLESKQTSPIFDQHTLRAVWALGLLGKEEAAAAMAWLTVMRRGSQTPKWKANGGGKKGLNCYEGYLKAIVALLQSVDSEQRSEVMKTLDRFLMPLGQQIKRLGEPHDLTTNLSTFADVRFNEN